MRTEIVDVNGMKGEVKGITDDEQNLIVALAENRQVTIPLRQVAFKGDHLFHLSTSFNEYLSEGSMTIPVIEEVPRIQKRLVDDSKVKIKKSVKTRTETIEETLKREEVEVKRVAHDRYLDEPAEVRVENGTTIIPVQEEVLVVQKRILLKEEIHIRKSTVQETQRFDVELRKEEVKVQREELRKKQ